MNHNRHFSGLPGKLQSVQGMTYAYKLVKLSSTTNETTCDASYRNEPSSCSAIGLSLDSEAPRRRDCAEYGSWSCPEPPSAEGLGGLGAFGLIDRGAVVLGASKGDSGASWSSYAANEGYGDGSIW